MYHENHWYLFRPQIAELTGDHPNVGEDLDTQVDSDVQSANISDFAQWVQQERFPLFVKVSFHLPFFRDIRHHALEHYNKDKHWFDYSKF